MGDTVYIHQGEGGKVEWDRCADNAGLRINVVKERNRTGTDVAVFCTPDVLADLTERLLGWPDVLAIVAKRTSDAAAGIASFGSDRDVSAVAKAYFRRGFLMFGGQVGGDAIEAVRGE
jgi:hypothetical protein